MKCGRRKGNSTFITVKKAARLQGKGVKNQSRAQELKNKLNSALSREFAIEVFASDSIADSWEHTEFIWI